MESASGSDSNPVRNTSLPTKNRKKNKKNKTVSQEPKAVSGLEKILKYKFNNPKLLEEAMTHSSCNSCNYERLEFIGDALINWMMANDLYNMYPGLAQGPLTRLRGLNVDNEKFARASIKHGFYKYLRHQMNAKKFENTIQEFKKEIEKYPVHSNGLIIPPKFLADIFESTAGAVFIDSNNDINTVWKAFKGLLEPLIGHGEVRDHPVTELQELCQKNVVSLKYIEENGIVSVMVDNQLAGTGSATSKDTACNIAATAALKNFHFG